MCILYGTCTTTSTKAAFPPFLYITFILSSFNYTLVGGIEALENLTILLAPYVEDEENEEAFEVVAFFNGSSEEAQCKINCPKKLLTMSNSSSFLLRLHVVFFYISET